MKVVERVLEGQSNMGGERVGMSIDQSALSHIMSVLTDLYSDPELAVIREYSTNALDSHVEAGVTRPIEITLPSPLSPFFRIRDFGLGLDADGIRDVYSQYGTSTKRNSNDVVGMLGLGCKSALTYTDQFTLTGIKGGVMTQVSVSRDEDGSGSMTIVAQHETDDENGVEVIVPAKRHNAFEAKAHSFFSYWQPNTVLVNGEHPKRVDGLWLDDKLLLVEGHATSYVVMGNVPYPIPDEDDPSPGVTNRYGSRRSHHTVAFVNIGDVQFTPSREALQMTKLTKATLAQIKSDVKDKLLVSVQKQVANAATAADAMAVYKQAKLLGIQDGLTYKGRAVMDTFKREGDPRSDNKAGFLVAGSDSYRRKSGDRYMTISMDANYNRPTIWFKNFDQVGLSATMREKLRVYATQRGLNIDQSRMVFIKEYTTDELFWLTTVHDWEDVAAIKLESKNRTTENGRPRGSYQGRQNGQWSDKILAETIDTSKPILWMQGNRWSIQGEPEMRAGIVPDNATLIALPGNRIEKFCRDFPTAKKFRDFGKEYAQEYVKKQKEDDLEAARFQLLGPTATRLAALDPARVNDPELKFAITRAQRKVDGIIKTVQSMVRWIGDFTLNNGKPPVNPAENYPLLPMHNLKGCAEHVYLYVNAAYAAGRSA